MNTTTHRIADLIDTIGEKPDHISPTFVTFPTEDAAGDGNIVYGHNCFAWEQGRWEGFWSIEGSK